MEAWVQALAKDSYRKFSIWEYRDMGQNREHGTETQQPMMIILTVY